MADSIWADIGLVLVGVFAGVAGSVATPRLYNHFFGPKLEATITDEDDCNTITTMTDASGKEVAFGRYIRVKVKNTGRSTAKNCVAYLSAVDLLDSEDIVEPSWRYVDMLGLHWTGHGEDAAVNLPPNISAYVDVISARSNSQILYAGTKVSLNRYTKLWEQKGRFRFTVLVSADETKLARTTFEIDWQGNWLKVKAQPVG